MDESAKVFIVLSIVPRNGLSGETTKSLGQTLEECVINEPDLEGLWQRETYTTDHPTLGSVWEGSVAFILHNASQLQSLCQAIVTALRPRSRSVHVDIIVKYGDNQVRLKGDHLDLSDVTAIRKELVTLCRSLAKLPTE